MRKSRSNSKLLSAGESCGKEGEGGETSDSSRWTPEAEQPVGGLVAEEHNAKSKTTIFMF